MANGSFGRFFDVFTAKPGSDKAFQYGRFALPAEEKVELPAGRVRIYFETSASDLQDDSSFKAPDDLSVRITGAAGGEVPIRHKLKHGVRSAESRGFARTYVGRVEVPSEGTYTVAATRPSGDFPDPHLALGK